MKANSLSLLLLLLFVLLLAAVGTSFIPWGDPRFYHGTGVPFPREYWEGGVHYPAPYGPLFNILLFWIVGFIGLLAFRMIGSARRRS
ncbi:MAG: hypothetical protein JWO82_2309 [Akkermansiaceae bacterium]|nr:hypothetical protein [Akkermansiaceae bacterium]